MESPMEKPHHHHFTHEHPLEHTNSTPKPNTTCFGCKGRIFPGHNYYHCKTCTFSLHQICHDMPKKIEHPSDPNHHFTLQSTLVSAEETYNNCRACGHHIMGLYYTCDECRDFYHILCLIIPLSVKISSHVHTVKLEFSPLYDFECDLCKEPSYSGWLYRCESCEFDAHINCAVRSKGEEWIEQGSMARGKGHELMELIAQGMNRSDQLPLQAHPGQLSPSYQFSDALFSIDFAKSLLQDENIGHENKGSLKKANEDPSNQDDRTGVTLQSREPTPKKEIITSTPKGIGHDIWSEIGRESEKRKSSAYRSGKDDTEKRNPEIECLECSCWPSLSFCLCCERN